MIHMFARQINDFETYTYATTEITSYSPPTFYWNLNTIQENNSIFDIFLSFSFFFFQRNFIPFLYFFFYIFFLNNYNKNNNTPPHLPFGNYYTFPKQKDIRSHYHRLANISKQRWDGVGEQRKRLMSDQFKRAS